MSQTSLIYRSAWLYEGLMRALYGRHYSSRMRLVAELVPPESSVVELCCGPGTLYRRHLAGRVSAYTGLDINPGFVSRLRARGVDAAVVDCGDPAQPLPAADILLIQASLYHFLPDAAALVNRMLAAARRLVIVAEPIRNLSSSNVPLLARLGQRSTDPGVGDHAQRFDEASLDALMDRYRERIREAITIPGGREKIYVLSAGGRGTGRASPTTAGSSSEPGGGPGSGR